MLSPVVTALSFCVMLLISANFIIGAWPERKRQKVRGYNNWYQLPSFIFLQHT